MLLNYVFFSYVMIYVQAHNDLLKAFEAKLTEYGIPLEEMGLPHYISNVVN